MASHEGLALVLDATAYRETSSLVRLLTESEGRISLVARGIRKGKGGSGPATMQAFSLVRIRYFLKDGATLGNLATAELEHAFPAARTSLEAYALCSYWFEILKESSQPRESVEQVFSLTLKFLQLQETAPGLSLTFLRQLSSLCGLLGFGLSWRDCAGCGRPVAQPTRFSIRSGAVLCAACVEIGREGLMLRPEEQHVIAHLAAQADSDNVANIAQPALLGAMGLIHRYLVYHLEHPLKTYAFVESIFSK